MTRKLLAFTASALVVVALTLRLYLQFIPWGASLQPYLLASRDGPAITSPDNAINMEVVFNDAGAAHSGNHWTWFVTYSPLWGRRVVAQGYVSFMVAVDHNGAHDPLPIKWLDDRTLEIEFRDTRQKSTTTTHTVHF